MKIIDGQMHDPAPWLDWTESDLETQYKLLTEIMLGYLDSSGVDGVLLFTSEDSGPAVARTCPSRVAYVPGIRPDVPDIEAAVVSAKAKRKDGLVALRAVIGWPLDGSEVKRLEDGGWEPVFSACERHQVPVFIFLAGSLSLAAGVAERYPELTLIIDHLGLRQPPMDKAESPPFKALPELLDLAKFPNVGVKVCGFPALSKEPYPYQDVIPHLRAIVDAFGADRLLWASDISRFNGRLGLHRTEVPGTQGGYEGKHTYSESLNFIRYCDALTDDEKEEILGGTVRRLLGWPAESS